MASPDSLKRLGGGRWETKDGRFQIEPQSGTWVIVDTTQTNEFGLPLVRGPFGTLTAAREAIETARDEGPVESPLADRIVQARDSHPAKPPSGSPKAAPGRKRADPEPEPESDPEPRPPPDPKWVRELGATDRRMAKELIERLDRLGVDESEAIARRQIAKREPALARLALARRLRDAAGSRKERREAIEVAIEIILAGKDDETGAEWRLTDGDGRAIESLDLDR